MVMIVNSRPREPPQLYLYDITLHIRIIRQTWALTMLLNIRHQIDFGSRERARRSFSRRPLQEEAHRVEAFALVYIASADDSKPILKQYLCHFKSDTPGSLPIRNGKIGRETWVSDYRCQCVAMLMGLPLTVWTNQ